MNAHSSLKWFISLFVVLMSCSRPVFAGPTLVYGGDVDLPILDKPLSGNSMTEAIIKVPDHLTILDLDVGINVTHTNVFDLHVFVQSPIGTRICLNKYKQYSTMRLRSRLNRVPHRLPGGFGRKLAAYWKSSTMRMLTVFGDCRFMICGIGIAET
ncbi:MAG: hypothetical protein RQ760_06140 [Sedimentisphaerales bacterium]|nr:hypothetical protein [Sedimentisphaerales bacterium]